MTNIDEDIDEVIASSKVWAAGSREYASSQTGLAVQIDHDAATGSHTGAAASWGF